MELYETAFETMFSSCYVITGDILILHSTHSDVFRDATVLVSAAKSDRGVSS